jgi:hypothetical protein
MEDYTAVRKRPVGVSILTVLALIGAVLMTVAIGFGAIVVFGGDERVRQAREGLAEMGMPLPLLAVGVIFLAALAWASGIGMWIGSKWGWYCGSFWYAYAIVRNVAALVTIYGMSDVISADLASGSARGPGYYYFKHGGRIVVNALIFLYFFKTNVREYFGLADSSRWKAALLEFGICGAIGIGGSALALLFE